MKDGRIVFSALTLITVLLCLPALFTHSLAFDGAIYGNIAALLNQGHGSFWTLPYFDSSLEPFRDHPPLGIWLYSLGKLWLGELFWVEKLIGLGTALVLALTMLGVQRQLTNAPPMWWTWILFIAMPLTTDVWMGGYLENILAPVVLAAMTTCLAARRSLVWSIPYGLLTYLAVLIKGPVGLFPLLIPLGIWMLDGKFWPAFKIGVCGLFSFVAVFAITLYAWPEALEHFVSYVQLQVFPSLTGDRPAQYDRLDLLLFFAKAMVVPILIVALAARTQARWDKHALFLWFMTLLFVLPLLISARHYDHYLLPGLALAALALAYTFPEPRTPAYLQRNLPVLTSVIAVVCIAWGWWSYDSLGRHADDIHDADNIATHKPSLIAYCDGDQSLKARAYLFRRHQIRSQPWIASEDSSEVNWVLCHTSPHTEANLTAVLHDNNKLWRLN